MDQGRRKLLALCGGAAAAWPLLARAQQGQRVRRVGVLINARADDPDAVARIAALEGRLQELGWHVGDNLRIDTHWAAGTLQDSRKHAAELISLVPDVIVASTLSVAPVLELTRIVPIVFVNVTDPVAGGFVESLARPGGNATGFTLFEYGTSTKWLELLKEVAPGINRVGVLRDPTIAAGAGQFGAIQAVAPALRVELHPLSMRDAADIERAIGTFARYANSGLIVTASVLANFQRELIIALAARHTLPTVYFLRQFVTRGGLISYGTDPIDPYRRAAGYVDRILKGEKPADLPVQAPTKYDLVINLKTAKALGLEVPDTLLARADEVIE
jgi:putative ABC transport system substrate-binding protein